VFGSVCREDHSPRKILAPTQCCLLTVHQKIVLTGETVAKLSLSTLSLSDPEVLEVVLDAAGRGVPLYTRR